MLKRFLRSVQTLWLILGITPILGIAKITQASTELARINQKVITLEEFNKRYQENLKYFPSQPPSKKAVLEDLIKRELAIQEAKKQSLDQTPEFTDRVNTLLFNAWVEKTLKSKVDQIQVTQDEAKERYKREPIIRTSQILVRLDPQASPKETSKALAKLKLIQKELAHHRPFSEVAQKYSDGPAAALGGDLDFQPKERLDPNYYQTALNLKTPGKISPTIKTQLGYQIIQLTAIKSWSEVDASALKRVILEEKKSQLFSDLMGTLKSQASIETHLELIKEEDHL